MVSTVGPLSSRKPSATTIAGAPARRRLDRSTIVMSWPRFDRCAAADRPPSPAPITTAHQTAQIIDQIIRPERITWCGRSRSRRGRRARSWPSSVMSATLDRCRWPLRSSVGDVRFEFVEARRCRRWSAGCARHRRRTAQDRRRGRARLAGTRRRGRPHAPASGVGLPSMRSPPTGLPVTAASPKAPITSSRIWKASPSGSPYALSCGSRSSSARDRVRPARRRGAADVRSCTCPTCTGRCARP